MKLETQSQALQLTDTQLQRADEAFNMTLISTAYLKRMGTVRLSSVKELWVFPLVPAPLEAEVMISLFSLSRNEDKGCWSKVALYHSKQTNYIYSSKVGKLIAVINFSFLKM